MAPRARVAMTTAAVDHWAVLPESIATVAQATPAPLRRSPSHVPAAPQCHKRKSCAFAPAIAIAKPGAVAGTADAFG